MTEVAVLHGRSFIARLGGTTPDKWTSIGVTNGRGRAGPAQDGWVVLNTQQKGFKPCDFFFDYAGVQGGRAHYAVYGMPRAKTQTRYHLGRLEVSRNGYLGLYRYATSFQRWSLALAEPPCEGWYEIAMASAQGDSIRAFTELQTSLIPNQYETMLNLRSGKPLRLRAKIVHLFEERRP